MKSDFMCDMSFGTRIRAKAVDGPVGRLDCVDLPGRVRRASDSAQFGVAHMSR